MTFKFIANSTPAVSTDVNENFYHIGRGDIIPMAGTSLSYIDNYCNLGSTECSWNVLYASYIQTTTSDVIFVRKATIEVSSPSSRIDMSGLTDYRMFKIYGTVKFSNADDIILGVTFNGVSSASYGQSGYYIDDTSNLIYTTSSQYIQIWRSYRDTSYVSFITDVFFEIYGFNRKSTPNTSTSNISIFYNVNAKNICYDDASISVSLIVFNKGFGLLSALSGNSLSSIQFHALNTTTALFTINTKIDLYGVGDNA